MNSFLKLLRLGLLALLFLLACVGAAPGQTKNLTPGQPQLSRRGSATQLLVEGKPFLILGGELHNSSSSSNAYMQPIWPRLAGMHLNTVLAPVAWETIESEEGHFDFSVVDGLIDGARGNNLHLVLLWFGSWKNTYSGYVPAWVKTNTERFPRVQTADGRSTERLSPFSAANRDADVQAYTRLMRHIREIDGTKHTVLMVQVENEVGVIPESRDHSVAAETAFAAGVPAALTGYLEKHRAMLAPELRTAWEANGAKTSGSWREVFGKSSLTDDLFMGWHYATYINRVAAAGKAEYPIPMYANAALIRPNYEPGQYNSGGPLPHSIDLWRAGAPSLDFFSPDIYFNEFAFWAQSYTRPENPLFIPEAQGGAAGAANALYAFGALSAIGFCPFGIEDLNDAPVDLVGISTSGDRADSSAIANTYATLANLAPIILDAQSKGTVVAAVMEGDAQRAARLRVGEYIATLTRSGNTAGTRISAMVLQTAPGEFLVTGRGDAQITFSADTPGAPITGISSIDELFYENGKWTPRRRLNGDEDSQGQGLKLSYGDSAVGRIYRVRLYRYR